MPSWSFYLPSKFKYGSRELIRNGNTDQYYFSSRFPLGSYQLCLLPFALDLQMDIPLTTNPGNNQSKDPTLYLGH